MSPLDWRHLAVLAILSVATGANAQTVGYAAGYDTLYRVTLESGAATSVGRFGSVASGAGTVPISDVEGLAFAPNGELYAVSDARDLLFKVDTTTGQATVVGSLGLRGQELMRAIRLDFPDVEVIIITGHGDLDSATDAVRHGICDYLQKPFDVVQVTAAVYRALSRRQVWRQPRWKQPQQSMRRIRAAVAKSTAIAR